MQREKSFRRLILSGEVSVVIPAILLASFLGAALGVFAVVTDIPLFLDSIGTAVIAALFGVVPGLLTGFLTNLFAELLHPGSVPFLTFAPVNMSTGLVVGILAWRFDLSRPGVLGATLVLVTLFNVILGSLTALIVHSGVTATSVDFLVASLTMTGYSRSASAFLARIPTNFVDKSIAVIAAYWAYLAVYGEGWEK
jgi:energy-coupling factor transport system substrate-specific component